VKRVIHGSPDSQSLWEISAFLELKTVWHPIGVLKIEILGSGGACDYPAARFVSLSRLRRGTRKKECRTPARARACSSTAPDVLIDTPEESKAAAQPLAG